MTSSFNSFPLNYYLYIYHLGKCENNASASSNDQTANVLIGERISYINELHIKVT